MEVRQKCKLYLQKQILPEKIFFIEDTANVVDSIVDIVIFKEWQIK